MGLLVLGVEVERFAQTEQSSVHIAHNQLGLAAQHIRRNEPRHLLERRIQQLGRFSHQIGGGHRILDPILNLR